MRAVGRIATGCALASLLGGAIYCQGVSTTTNAREGIRTTDLNGVRSIAGHPFSADVEIDHTQTLADGSHIHTVRHMKIFRDNEGRIREEQYRHAVGGDSPDELDTVQILDSNANVQLLLHPRSRTAQRTVVFFAPVDPPAAPRPNTSPAPSQSVQTTGSTESLGVHTIEGVSATGRRSTTIWPINMVGNDAPLSMVTETWNSLELGL